jgi:hypothetical protein
MLEKEPIYPHFFYSIHRSRPASCEPVAAADPVGITSAEASQTKRGGRSIPLCKPFLDCLLQGCTRKIAGGIHCGAANCRRSHACARRSS